MATHPVCNKIGDFWFLALLGTPEPPREHLLIEERPGVDGSALWKTGKRGDPFRLQSIVVIRSFAEADQLYAQYLELIGADPVGLLWGNVDQAARKFDVCVLNVQRIRQAALGASVGDWAASDPDGAPKAYLECAWDLAAIETKDS